MRVAVLLCSLAAFVSATPLPRITVEPAEMGAVLNEMENRYCCKQENCWDGSDCYVSHVEDD